MERHQLRTILLKFSNNDLNAICADYFQDFHEKFGEGQEKNRLITGLLDYYESDYIEQSFRGPIRDNPTYRRKIDRLFNPQNPISIAATNQATGKHKSLLRVLIFPITAILTYFLYTFSIRLNSPNKSGFLSPFEEKINNNKNQLAVNPDQPKPQNDINPKITINAPSLITEGSVVNLTMSTNLPVYVFAYSCDKKGWGTAIFPQHGKEAPWLQPGQVITLPPLKAKLLTRKAAEEVIVVYGFSSLDDFNKYRPLPNSVAKNVYAVEQEAKRAALKGWTLAQHFYRIQPRP